MSDPCLTDLCSACSDLARFGRIVKLTAFKPFPSAADSLEQINAISEAQLTDELKNFLELNLPKVRGTAAFVGLGGFAPAMGTYSAASC